MKKQQIVMTALVLAAVMVLTACGGKTGGTAQTEAGKTETTAAESQKAVETTEDEPQKATETTEAPAKEETTAADLVDPSQTTGDVGRYVLYEYEANGNKVSHDMLMDAGMGDTYLELYEDGTGKLNLFQSLLDITWKPGEITVYGTSQYTYEIKGDELLLDMQGVNYVMKRDGDGAASPDTDAKEQETEAETAAIAGTSEGVPGGDGIVGSEEELQKDYVWMSKVAKDIFHTSYEELVEQFGVEGKFDKEEYSEHMKVNKRYYFWISPENKNHFFYVNFEEDDPEGAPGVYTVSGYNSSGFLGSEAEEKYLDEVKAAASAADKAASANMKMKDFSVEVHPFGKNDDIVKFSMQIPESGWAYDENKDHLVENEDVNTFGAGFIQFKVDTELSKFDFYKDQFENYQEIEDRQIGGVTFAGRTYKNIGYEWTEYIAQIDDAHAVSIGIVRVDTSEGSMGDKILNSISFQ